MKPAAEKVADELYGLAPADFIAARGEHEKWLRKEGDREAAAEVKALRKPTVPAWALNQVARSEGKDVKKLIAAGAKLRKAQDELLGGGKRTELDKATRSLRELTTSLGRAAVAVARDAGQGTAAAFQEAVGSTLHAAALEEEVGAELAAGRLIKERELVSLFGLGAGGEPVETARGSSRKPAPKKEKAKPAKAAKGATADAKAKAAAEKKANAAEERRRERELKAARDAQARAGRAAEAALRALEQERDRAAKAAERVAAAERDAEAASERLAEASADVERLGGKD